MAKLFRINEGSGKADVFFDSEEDHLVSVAVASRRHGVLTGSNGKGAAFPR